MFVFFTVFGCTFATEPTIQDGSVASRPPGIVEPGSPDFWSRNFSHTDGEFPKIGFFPKRQ